MQSRAKTVEAYLASLPADRRAALSVVRTVIRKNLDRDYAEGMLYGMIGYFVPHDVYPAGYHCDPSKPLLFAALASQKNYMSLYLASIYGSAEQLRWIQQAWAEAGKKLDMGKSCLRFKTLDDLVLDVIGAAIKRVPAKNYVAACEAMLGSRQKTATSKAKSRVKKSEQSPRRNASKVAKKSPRRSRT